MAMLRELRSEFSFELDEVDIETDDGLLSLYQWRIPVVTIDGAEAAAAPIESDVLRKALASA
jgi:hypothetical protein